MIELLLNMEKRVYEHNYRVSVVHDLACGLWCFISLTGREFQERR
jgi:hypothetical protein